MPAEKPLKEQIAERIASPSFQLPVFSAVALELQKVLGDENAGASRIEGSIAKDPALAVQVLRMANSAHYSGLSEITTVRQAVMRLGAKQVGRLAIAAAQLSLYRTKDAMLASYMDALWQQAYASAVGSSWVAEKAGHTDLAEPAFLAGLLHDIGKLLIVKALEEIAAGSNSGPALSKTLIDEAIEGLHCEYGYHLMKRWNLPEQFCIVARDHHAEGYDAKQSLMIIVRLLDRVCAKMGLADDGDTEEVPAASPEARALGISEVHLAELEVMLEDTVGAQPA